MPADADASSHKGTSPSGSLSDRPAASKPQPKEDLDVKESEAKKLREANEELNRLVSQQNGIIAKLKAEIEELKRPGVTISQDRDFDAEDFIDGEGGSAVDFEVLYSKIKARAAADPGLLSVLAGKPEIEVRVERRKIEMNGETLGGQCAVLISEGFFDGEQTGNSAFNELKRRGRSVAKRSVYRELDKIAGLGFLTKETGGYKAVPGMKVNVMEA